MRIGGGFLFLAAPCSKNFASCYTERNQNLSNGLINLIEHATSIRCKFKGYCIIINLLFSIFFFTLSQTSNPNLIVTSNAAAAVVLFATFCKHARTHAHTHSPASHLCFALSCAPTHLLSPNCLHTLSRRRSLIESINAWLCLSLVQATAQLSACTSC